MRCCGAMANDNCNQLTAIYMECVQIVRSCQNCMIYNRQNEMEVAHVGVKAMSGGETTKSDRLTPSYTFKMINPNSN